jgi:hypothetical protein
MNNYDRRTFCKTNSKISPEAPTLLACTAPVSRLDIADPCATP